MKIIGVVITIITDHKKGIVGKIIISTTIKKKKRS